MKGEGTRNRNRDFNRLEKKITNTRKLIEMINEGEINF